MAKKRITENRKKLTESQKKKRLDTLTSETTDDEFNIDYCWKAFIVNRMVRGNSDASIDAYKRFYKRLCAMVPIDEATGMGVPNFPISMIDEDAFKASFIATLKKPDGSPVSVQTVNHYMRSYRAFGKFCEDEGYIPDGFTCPIKEVAPPIKDVYTDAELKRLLKEPSIEDFVAYRNYAIINLLLSTGARTNTILTVEVKDFDGDTGYITFNTTKAHIPIKEGLPPKCIDVLRKYVERWRSFDNTQPTDRLFCNFYGEPLTRSGLTKTIKEYNKAHDVDKTSLHLFRHTFAKKWIKDGGDIIQLARVLTHSELEMVKRYSNLYSTDVKEAIVEHSALSQLRPRRGKSLKSNN